MKHIRHTDTSARAQTPRLSKCEVSSLLVWRIRLWFPFFCFFLFCYCHYVVEAVGFVWLSAVKANQSTQESNIIAASSQTTWSHVQTTWKSESRDRDSRIDENCAFLKIPSAGNVDLSGLIPADVEIGWSPLSDCVSSLNISSLCWYFLNSPKLSPVCQSWIWWRWLAPAILRF